LRSGFIQSRACHRRVEIDGVRRAAEHVVERVPALARAVHAQWVVHLVDLVRVQAHDGVATDHPHHVLLPLVVAHERAHAHTNRDGVLAAATAAATLTLCLTASHEQDLLYG
jgi:hypothetical protein